MIAEIQYSKDRDVQSLTTLLNLLKICDAIIIEDDENSTEDIV